ncbi:MAG TPA: radical SAM family heme chaperone HemW [Candidatus Sumerlaeota bacterium]|nr:radical SAM family heme chaperone HemW [Candidatus Sumerlaeota bacterium]
MPSHETLPRCPEGARRFGLYLHVPFCLSKCPYCDFVSFSPEVLDETGREALIRALEDELTVALRAFPELRGRALDTVYFGGGTPSLLEPGVLAHLLDLAHGVFRCADLEVTLECNPVTAQMDRLAAFQAAGVNRISLGVQSFDPETLRRLGRRHSAEDSREACRRVRELGFRSWGLDLIFGTPLPSEDHSVPDSQSVLNGFERDLETAITHRPPHLSVYGMTLHEGTPFHDRYGAGQLTLPDEETQRDLFLLARRRLTAAGWRHYEISNYAWPGHESRHNTLYWSGGEYLGLGVSAHSCFAGRRRANPADAAAYLDRVRKGQYPAEAETQPCERSLRGERIMLALRQVEGVAVADLDRSLGCDFRKTYSQELVRLCGNGLLQLDGERVALTEEGLLLSDSVFEEFF